MLAIQGILSSCLFHTLTRDLVKCVGNTGNPLKLFISYLNERSCKMCWQYWESSQNCLFHTFTRDLVKCVGNTGNPLKLFISYLNERSGKMCWQYRESSQVVYFIP